ncbi:hypothetical protein EZS27_030037, partial [termite gut metagenome]
LNWQKSPVLLPVKIEIEGTSFYTDARLSFRESPEGDLKLRIHPQRTRTGFTVFRRPLYR